jgi:chemotaxis protein methyltransferase WspC
VTSRTAADERSIAAIGALLRARGGIAPELADARAIDSLVRARCAAGAAPSLDAYAQRLQSDPQEMDRLIAEVAVPETWFFRYPRSFDVLRDLLSRHAGQSTGRVRILSVGCAGGCEPVSIAVAALASGIDARRIEVIAVDRNPRVVDDAQCGRWPAHALRDGIPAWAGPWMRQATPALGDRATPSATVRDWGTPAVEVDPAVRACIQWRVADATRERLCEAKSCAAVFCRNVLIYLDAPTRDAMLSALAEALDPQGLLFLGHAESMVGRMGLQSHGESGAFAWRPAAAPGQPAPVRQASHTRQHRTAPPLRTMPTPSGAHGAEPAAARDSLARPHARESLAPAQDALAPVQDALSPAQDALAPAKDALAPAKDALARAQVALAAGDRDTARAALTQFTAMISRAPTAPCADDLEMAAGLLSSIGDLDSALALYSRIAFVQPTHDRALLAMAELAESLGRPDEATRHRARLRRLVTRQHQERQP